jgi:hypothetical protein
MPRDPDIERRRVFARNLRIARQRAHGCHRFRRC